jgi:ferrous-iron efflux pump FieF
MYASAGVAATLVGMKLAAAALTGALTVAAALADSILDLAMSLTGLLALAYAARPPDEDHHFGHSSVEDLMALAQSLFLLLVALGLVIGAWLRVLSPEPAALGSEGIGIAVMLLSSGLTLWLVAWQGRVLAQTGNKIVAADRLHYLGDLVPNLGAAAALAASRWGGTAHLDTVFALVAAVFLARGAFKIGRGAWDALMDRRAEPDISAGIAALASTWPGVLAWHDLKTRTAGSRVFVHLHVELDGRQSLAEAHEIGASLRRAIVQRYPQADVIIHKDVAPGTEGQGEDHGDTPPPPARQDGKAPPKHP